MQRNYRLNPSAEDAVTHDETTDLLHAIRRAFQRRNRIDSAELDRRIEATEQLLADLRFRRSELVGQPRDQASSLRRLAQGA